MRAVSLVFVVAALLLSADDKVDNKGKPKPEQKKAEAVDRAKQADAWVEKFSKSNTPNGPTWWEVFGALERKYGKGKVPCGTFDSAREKFYEELVRPEVLKEGTSESAEHMEFMKLSNLPTAWTWTGKKRKGCLEE